MKHVIKLTHEQYKKLSKGQAVNINLENPRGEEHIIHMSDPKLFKKISSHISRKKNMRLHGDMIKMHKLESGHEYDDEEEHEPVRRPKKTAKRGMMTIKKKGGKINIGNAFKSLGHDITHVANQAGSQIKQGVFDWNNAMKNNPTANKIVYSVAPDLTQAIASNGVKYGLSALGMPGVGNVLGNVSGNAAKIGVQQGLKSQGYGSGLVSLKTGRKPLTIAQPYNDVRTLKFVKGKGLVGYGG